MNHNFVTREEYNKLRANLSECLDKLANLIGNHEDRIAELEAEILASQIVESYDKEESDWKEIKKEFEESIEELKSVLKQCIKGKK